MIDNHEQLIAITQEVKTEIAELDVAPPLLYKTLFNTHLQEQNISIENEDELVDKIVQEKFAKLSILQQDTSSSIIKLGRTAKDAVEAINEKDSQKLETVLKETLLLRKEIERLKASVFVDMLTKAHNRQWLYAHYLDNNESFTCNGVLVFIDMNFFKEINDVYGHIAGDKVLEFMSIHLKKIGTDIIRYGGDEFLLLFENISSLEMVKKKMEQNRDEILKKELRFRGNSFHTSYSYGLVLFHEGADFHEILSAADLSMYEDKEKFKKIETKAEALVKSGPTPQE